MRRKGVGSVTDFLDLIARHHRFPFRDVARPGRKPNSGRLFLGRCPRSWAARSTVLRPREESSNSNRETLRDRARQASSGPYLGRGVLRWVPRQRLPSPSTAPISRGRRRGCGVASDEPVRSGYVAWLSLPLQRNAADYPNDVPHPVQAGGSPRAEHKPHGPVRLRRVCFPGASSGHADGR